MNKYTIIPSSQKYKSAPFVDQEISLSLEEQSQQITEYGRSQSISLAQLYDDERQKCTIFRPTFKVNYLYSNTYTGMLTQYLQNKAEYGKDFHSIMNLISIDLILLTNILFIKLKVLIHIIGLTM